MRHIMARDLWLAFPRLSFARLQNFVSPGQVVFCVATRERDPVVAVWRGTGNHLSAGATARSTVSPERSHFALAARFGLLSGSRSSGAPLARASTRCSIASTREAAANVQLTISDARMTPRAPCSGQESVCMRDRRDGGDGTTNTDARLFCNWQFLGSRLRNVDHSSCKTPCCE